jgi:hypothetical protein
MNEEEILDLARKAIAAGESADDVARWIEESTGWNLVEMADRHDAQLRVAKGGSPASDFLHMAAEGATVGQADKLKGLGLRGMLDVAFRSGGNPVQMAGQAGALMATPQAQDRAASFQQRTDDLQRLAPGASAASALAGMVPGLFGGGSAGLSPAMSAIRTARGQASRLAKNPFVRRLLPWGGGALLGRMLQGD